MIWLGYRTPHLGFDQLPPQCDYDRINFLITKYYPVCLLVAILLELSH